MKVKLFEFDFTFALIQLLGGRYLTPVVALADYGTFSPYCSNQASKQVSTQETAVLALGTYTALSKLYIPGTTHHLERG